MASKVRFLAMSRDRQNPLDLSKMAADISYVVCSLRMNRPELDAFSFSIHSGDDDRPRNSTSYAAVVTTDAANRQFASLLRSDTLTAASI